MTKIPSAIGPYSAYRKSGDLLITSGQLPLDPETNRLEGDTTYLQAKQSLKNIKVILETESIDFSKILKLTVYMTNLDDFVSVNKAFEEELNAPYPARTAIQISQLPMHALVEIEATAEL
ncbi:MAG: RidA family protein [Lactobacillus sp.]|nr:MAG: RidA family protein [Lactobacillus sp.]